ncbi:arsenic resistance operon repressor [Actinotalea ferrariae CF5-4]|uniref:Arsenic resistance operon repressor n=1 Tax=Actinotalea ferrariae CF5-4 TaxID=948458 RepID=A0A021VYR4_9CELL|nr:arsenite efflux transporter metallochaperone ArsD [Actinotalea ferrariae]EYR65155.1 arsenic resistance operon repressor [Actinotalea ferrariae CF5-4]
MSTIEVFEPAMCCSTGVCGTDVPQELVTFSADLDWLRGRGQDVARFNLASEPAAFAGRPAVLDLLQVSGSEGLPLVLVDGAVAMAGRYPGRAELARWAGVAAEPAPSAVPTPDAPPAPSAVPAPAAVLPLAGGCCGGGSC